MDPTKTASTQPYRVTPQAQRIARERDHEDDQLHTCPQCRVEMLYWQQGDHRCPTPAPSPTRRIVTAQGIGQLIETTEPDGRLRLTAPYRCHTCHTPHVNQFEADVCCRENELTGGAAYDVLSRHLAAMLRRIE